MNNIIATVALVAAVFLFLLNAVFAYVFRKKRKVELISYIIAGVVELAIFALGLSLRLKALHLPNRLPGVPITRAEVGAALAVGIGLFPAAYWHRGSVEQWRKRMEEDAKVMKSHEAGVRIRSDAPGEWMN